MWKKVGLWFIVISIIGSFYVFIFTHLVNFPQIDDYDSILNFLNQFLRTPSVLQRLEIIFSQHNEHRLVVSNIIVLMQYYIFRHVDFKMLALLGDLSLIPLILIIYKSSKQKANKLLFFLPVIFLIFNMSAQQSFFWAMSAFSNIPIYFFAFACPFFLNKTGAKNFILAMIFALLAIFSQANGIFILFTGIFILTIKKNKKHLLFWTLFNLVVIGLYFAGYQRENGLSFWNIWPYFFTFIGSTASFGAAATVAFAAGVLCFLGFCLLIKNKYYHQNPVIFADLLFLFLTAFSNAASRSQFGANYALSSRYAIVSALIFCLLYLSCLETIKSDSWRNLFFRYLFGGSLALLIISYAVSYDLIMYRREKLARQEILYPDVKRAKKILLEAEKNKLIPKISVGNHAN